MGNENVRAVASTIAPVVDGLVGKRPVRVPTVLNTANSTAPRVSAPSLSLAPADVATPERVAVPEARSIGEDTEIKVDINNEARRPAVSIVDRETNRVILKIPPEQLLNLSANLRASIGDAFDREA